MASRMLESRVHLLEMQLHGALNRIHRLEEELEVQSEYDDEEQEED